MTPPATYLLTLLYGKHVGTDPLGNRYYHHRKNPAKRWVRFAAHHEDASQIPPLWRGWLHQTINIPPTQTTYTPYPWQKKHLPNLSSSSPYHPNPNKSPTYSAWKPKNFKEINHDLAK